MDYSFAGIMKGRVDDLFSRHGQALNHAFGSEKEEVDATIDTKSAPEDASSIYLIHFGTPQLYEAPPAHCCSLRVVLSQ
jgi:hypothetical protein